MFRRVIFMLALILFRIESSLAYSETICGSPPVVTDEHIKVGLDSAASEAVEKAGHGGFSYVLVEERRDIFARYAEGARAIAYYQYIVCRLLEKDDVLNVQQKIDALNQAFSILKPPNQKSHSAYSFLVLNLSNGASVIEKSTIVRDGSDWREIQSGRVVFIFRETGCDVNYVCLIDDSRSLELKIPLQGGNSFIRYSGEDTWNNWNTMHPATM